MGELRTIDLKYEYRNKYQTVHALRGVSCEFSSGSLYALTGRSGSGKSTLLSLLAGLDKPASGAIYLNERNILEMDLGDYRLNHISVIYQSLNLFPLLSVLDNVMFPLEYKKVPKSKAMEIAVDKLAAVNIDESMFKRIPSMLSGGEQQRVAIARALANQTEYILADEPTGNLDSENSAVIVELLRNLVDREGVCVIVATHDTMVAEAADIVIKLSDGLVVA